MQITSINRIDCNPKRISFTNKGESNSSKEKVRYKHYEEMNDDVLKLRSIINAHREVEKSGKMRFFKAIPAITTGLIGLSIGLTQPGKLSSKLASGLGFLALVGIGNGLFNKIDNVIDKKYAKNKKANQYKKPMEKLGYYLVGTSLLVAGLLNIKKLANIEKLKPVSNFISKEANTLAEEINSTKLAQKVDETLNPFMQRHKDTNMTLSILSPFLILGASALTGVKTADSLSNDIKEKAEYNYNKGKIVQALAKKHFDSLDAIEV